MITNQSIPADSFRNINMKWVWGGTFVLVVLILGIFDPLGTIAHLIENAGIGEDGATILAFVAGFTLPLTAGIALIVFIWLTGGDREYSQPAKYLGVAAILFASGLMSYIFGLGIAPDMTVYLTRLPVSGPVWIVAPAYVFASYISSYGWELMICALAIGITSAFQVERWLHGEIKT